jgi:hypothetical protein
MRVPIPKVCPNLRYEPWRDNVLIETHLEPMSQRPRASAPPRRPHLHVRGDAALGLHQPETLFASRVRETIVEREDIE